MTQKKQPPVVTKILVVDDEADFRWIVGNVLKDAGYHVSEAQDGQDALNLLRKGIFDCILLDYRMPAYNGLQVAEEIIKLSPSIPIIMITAYADVDSAVKAMKMGVYDYIMKPVNNEELLYTVQRALEKENLAKEVNRLKGIIRDRIQLFESMGSGDRIRKLVAFVEKVAPTSFNVLIEGESGVGKELVARAIHDLSNVREGPFIAIDCGSIPETLMESELFGYMKGAFTGAYADKPGQFELAEGGTLFLDEVGNIPYMMQHKLLRSIEEKRLLRLGAKKARTVNIRIIAATNKPLDKDVGEDRFRRDLFYRLSEFVIHIPPLRERKEDIAFLINKFITETEKELRKRCTGISPDALDAAFSYRWPGNVRELKNMIRKAVLLCDESSPISKDHLVYSHASDLNMTTAMDLLAQTDREDEFSLGEAVRKYIRAFEEDIIREALIKTGGNKSAAARKLGVDYKTLLRKIKTYHLES
jgi:DNA-binding NtrC family response regulator